MNPASLTGLDWGKVSDLTAEIRKCPVTWAGFGEAWELHRQIFIQRLSLPMSAQEWNAPIWLDLNRALVVHGTRLSLNLDRPHQRANLEACIVHAQDEIRVLLSPLSPEKEEEMNQAFGSPKPADNDDGEGEEWKRS